MAKKKPSLGDYVEVSLVKKSYRGVLLETPESEKGIVLLKLDSGYNIGFKKKKVIDIKFIRKISSEKKSEEMKKSGKKPNVAMIITGGTIASKYNPKTGAVDPLTSPEDLFKFYPEMFEKVNVSKVEIPFMKPSEDMDYKDWKKIAKTVKKLLNDSNIKGVIITHGTDTLHYTSAALSFFLKDLKKPVVLTYSQRSIDRASSDANLNLRCSAIAAISDIAEVMIVGHADTNDESCYAMPGTKTRKLHTSRRDAFKVVNDEAFAKISPESVEIISKYNLRGKGKTSLDLKFEDRVALVKVYPGQNPEILDYYLKKKYKGIVLEVYGLGQVPGKKWVRKVKEVSKKGLVICAAAQTIYGRLNPFVYSNGRKLVEAGAIFLEDMLAETALVKLGWVLGHEELVKDKEKVKEKMLENVSEELNKRLGIRL